MHRVARCETRNTFVSFIKSVKPIKSTQISQSLPLPAKALMNHVYLNRRKRRKKFKRINIDSIIKKKLVRKF